MGFFCAWNLAAISGSYRELNAKNHLRRGLRKANVSICVSQKRGSRMRIFEEWDGIATLALAIFLVIAAFGPKLTNWLEKRFPGDPSRLNPRNKRK